MTEWSFGPICTAVFVIIPPQVKHWHGAAADSWFSHLAIEVPGKELSNEWLEPVSDEQYRLLGPAI